jgi:hypothetical protein
MIAGLMGISRARDRVLMEPALNGPPNANFGSGAAVKAGADHCPVYRRQPT